MSNLRTVRDPYSDNPRDFAVWDDDTCEMPFLGSREQCERYRREIAAGYDEGYAIHLAHGGRRDPAREAEVNR